MLMGVFMKIIHGLAGGLDGYVPARVAEVFKGLGTSICVGGKLSQLHEIITAFAATHRILALCVCWGGVYLLSGVRYLLYPTT